MHHMATTDSLSNSTECKLLRVVVKKINLYQCRTEIDGEVINARSPDPPAKPSSPEPEETVTNPKPATRSRTKKKVAEVKKKPTAKSAKIVAARKRRLRKRKPASSKGNREKTKDANPAALLDMLAEVASATLKNDPTIQSEVRSSPRVKAKQSQNIAAKPSTKIAKTLLRRPPQSEVLNLDQIRMLSDKLLLNMFAELTADEIRRNYAYVCYLIPEKCQQKYTSFGNETKARLQMKAHLLDHIAKLLAETNTSGRSLKIKFTAEPVIARKRRLATEKKQQQQSRKLPIKSEKDKGKATPVKNKDQATSSNSKGTSVEEKSTASGTSDAQSGDEDKDYTKIRNSNEGKNNAHVEGEESNAEPNNNKEKEDEGNEIEGTAVPKVDGDQQAGPSKPDHSKMKAEEDEAVSEQLEDTGDDEDKYEALVIKEEIVFESENDVEIQDVNLVDSEMISYQQPYHDHCYTTLEGRKRPSEFEEDIEEEDADDDSCIRFDDETNGERPKRCKLSEMEEADELPPIVAPLVQLTEVDTSQNNSTILPTENLIRQYEVLCTLQTLQKPKKQMSQVRIGAADAVQELEDDDDDDMGSLEDDLEAAKQSDDKISPDWERKLALKCIRLLRTKKKDERIALVCKICKDKTFTAQATLMYHYRSHAGIKPFVCNICNTTFTRQHSLNYHMLIHNNKSRFTCSDCGRKFRHPSHFKEHMRRHTGETPFECSDCGVRFKTRNTYKRHLKTRHGKLLTVNGIVTLSAEEFQKVKTNPKRRPRPRKDKETQWPEVASIPSSSPMTSTETETSAANLHDFLAYDSNHPMEEGDVTEFIKEEDHRLIVSDRVVTKTMDYVDINTGTISNTLGAVQRPIGVNLGSDQILLKVPADMSSAHLQPGDGFAMESGGLGNEEIKILVACPNDKNEGGVTEWITATPVEVYPATTSGGIPKVIMQPILNGLGCLLAVDSQ